MELKHQNMVFFKLIECIIKKKICHGVKQYKELIRRERRDGGEGEDRGLRKGEERG